MNTSFKVSCYEIEITSDGNLPYKDDNMASGRQPGTIGLLVHSEKSLTDSTMTTRAAVTLKRNQARAIASALLSAVSEAQQ